MKHMNEIREDAALDWAMRIVGLTVFAASIFFIYRDLSLSPLYDYFFSMTALVGVATVAVTLLRTPSSAEWSRSQRPVLEPVSRRAN